MSHYLKSLRTGVCAVFALEFSIASSDTFAQSDKLGDVSIDIDLLNINNTISNSTSSTAKILATGVKNSTTTGDVDISLNAKKIGKGKRGLKVIEFNPNNKKFKTSGRVRKGQPSVTLFTGSRKDVMKLWKKALKKRDEINNLKLPYPTLGVKLFRRTINSNSVESTLSAAMGLKSPKLKLPLTIQDKEQAIEYDVDPEQSFLFTPGEGRIIPVN